MQPLNLSDFLPYRLARLSEAVSQEMRSVYRARHGLTRPEWRVLAALASLGEATATEVGQHSAQHKTKVSRAVAALEARRWLSRAPNPDDRRFERLSLTNLGKQIFRDLSAPLLAREAALLAQLSAAEREGLELGLAALERIINIEQK